MPADPVVALLPCPNPWCDCPNTLFVQALDKNTLFGVQCMCGFEGPVLDTRDGAITAWSTRTPAPAGDVRVDEAQVGAIAADIYAELAIEPLGDLSKRRDQVQTQWFDAVRSALTTHLTTPDSSAVSEPCGYCGTTPCRCGRTDLCQAPGCDKPTDRGICDNCDQWVSDQVGTDSSAVSGTAEGLREALSGLIDKIDVQAKCLEGYAESSGFSGKAPASVFHWQATHFRDLAAEMRAALTEGQQS